MFKFTLKDVAVNKRTINPYAGLPKKGSLFRIHPDNFIQSYVLFQHYNWHLLVGEELIETVAEASFIAGIFLSAISRPSQLAALWRRISRNKGGQCAINSDGVIVLSTVWRFDTLESNKSRDTVLNIRQKGSNCLVAKQQKLSSF